MTSIHNFFNNSTTQPELNSKTEGWVRLGYQSNQPEFLSWSKKIPSTQPNPTLIHPKRHGPRSEQFTQGICDHDMMGCGENERSNVLSLSLLFLFSLTKETLNNYVNQISFLSYKIIIIIIKKKKEKRCRQNLNDDITR